MDPQQQDVYPDQPREDVRPYIPRTATSALDVGCGKGGFGVSLRGVVGEEGRVVGVEAVPEQHLVASRGHGYDEVVQGYFPEALPRSEQFDVVCFLDVLEHMLDPWDVLARTHDYLTPDGVVLAAVPNVQYLPNLWGLARGRWDYTDQGILDRTHVRFFTKATIIEMFHRTGYDIEVCDGVNNVVDLESRTWRGRRSKARHLMGNAQWLHFVVIARPSAFARRTHR